jgi:hypothetical protein
MGKIFFPIPRFHKGEISINAWKDTTKKRWKHQKQRAALLLGIAVGEGFEPPRGS